ncbi:MAG TPA: dienelactone hydrolase family protein [Rhizomicrobium sp.]|jgi:dienelactone hydrolase
MDYRDALRDYESFAFTDGPWTQQVFRRGSGPGVIVIHEMPGLHPMVIRFADRVAAAGMSVFLPSLFGEPGRPVSTGYALQQMAINLCVRRAFNAWQAGRSSPIVDWLRALARRVHGECGGKGVGALGMCFTGGYALAMMTEPAMVAPVMSQPSMPLPFGEARKAGLDCTKEEIACARRRFETEDLSLLGLRFFGDPTVPDARFANLRRAFGSRFEAIEIDPRDSEPGPMKAHSVLTINLQDRPGTPTKQAEQRVIAFLKERTGA